MAGVLHLSFWPEFALEYAAGFAFGWPIFQCRAMRFMGNGPASALWESVPHRVLLDDDGHARNGARHGLRHARRRGVSAPAALPSFWGFASLGLLVGSLFTYPKNWWLVVIGWKHGMG